MKPSTRKIVLLIILNIAMGNCVLAQNTPVEKTATYTISGSVDLPGVVMEGLPGDVIADQRGYYSVAVPYGWSGTVTPVKVGYRFEPVSIRYTKVVRDLNDKDYMARPVRSNREDSDLYQGIEDSQPGSRSRIPSPDIDSRMGTSFSRSRRTSSSGYRPTVEPIGSRKVLVIPAEQVNAKELSEITEDMQVMSYILDERFKETRRIQGVFIDFGDFFGRDNRQTEATYLQGYGVLFSMEVNFSFSPPPQPQAQETEQPDEQVDSTWQRAKQEVLSPHGAAGTGLGASPDEYNSQMVEELKRDLITTLKHAANIRGLQPDEWVILTVIGTGRGSVGMGMGTMGGMSSSRSSAYGGFSSSGFGGRSYSASSGFGGGMGMGAGMGGTGMGGMTGPGEAPSATVLTIRAKKSDVDAFADGKIDFERFKENVRILMY